MLEEKLTLGEEVEWDPDVNPKGLPGMIERYGKGPFRIVGLKQLEEGDRGICPYTVTVETSDGSWQGVAGEWFRRAKATGRGPWRPRDHLVYGTAVMTAEPDEAGASRKWGCRGTVIKCYEGHGFVYEVEHTDGTRTFYHESELQVMT